jgi:drug/metabolite transporter (DMT)-like permease
LSAGVHLALIVVQILFASLSVAGKEVLPQLGPFALVMFRSGSAAICFLAWARQLPAPRDLLRLALYGLLGVTFNQLLFLTGLQYTTATNATVLGTMIPVWTVAIAILLRREPADPRRIIGVAVALAGALYLVGAERFTVAERGNILILLNALSYAFFLVLARDITKRYPARTVMAWCFFFGSLGVSVVGAPAVAHLSFAAVPTRTGAWLAFIIAGPTLGAYILNTWALARAQASQVAIYVYLQPVITALMAWPLLHERPAARTWISAGIIYAGIYIATGSALIRRAAERLPSKGASSSS